MTSTRALALAALVLFALYGLAAGWIVWLILGGGAVAVALSRARRLAHLMRNIRFEGDCWIWTGPVAKGYGKYSGAGSPHRAAYLLLVGPIPDGLELDHLCRNPLCAFPDHLEPVTHAENIRRHRDAKTHCKWGHEFTAENTRWYTRDGYARRACRACGRRNVARYQERKRAKGRAAA